MNDPFRDRLRQMAEAFHPALPDMAWIVRRGRVRKIRRTTATGGLGVLSVLAVGIPIYLLSGLGHPADRQPGAETSLSPPIAFTDANIRIALMRADGSDVRQITTGDERDAYATRYGSSQDLNPQWASDGAKVYFLRRYSESVYSLCSVSATGSAFRVVVRNFPAGQFAISPSGSRIAFGAGDGIYVGGIDGSPPHRVVPFPGLPGGIPVTWSPDGREIAFVSGKQQLWVLDISSGEIRRVTPSREHVETAAWNPVGGLIAYTRLSDFSHGAASAQVWTIRPDGTGSARLTDGTGFWTVTTWSPDGSHLLLGRLDWRGRDDGLATIGADGSDLQVLNKQALSGFGSWRA